MANSVPFRTTPQLGPQLDDVFTGLPYWDGALGVQNADPAVAPSYKLGNAEVGNDGHTYVFVKASANIASATPGTKVTITEPAFTVATDAAGLFRAPAGVAITSGQYFHVRREVL